MLYSEVYLNNVHKENVLLSLIRNFSALEKAEGTLSKIVFNNVMKNYVNVYKHIDPVVKQMEFCGRKSRECL